MNVFCSIYLQKKLLVLRFEQNAPSGKTFQEEVGFYGEDKDKRTIQSLFLLL